MALLSPTKSEGYSFGVVCLSIASVWNHVSGIDQIWCIHGMNFKYMDSRYPIGFVKIDSLTFELLPLT